MIGSEAASPSPLLWDKTRRRVVFAAGEIRLERLKGMVQYCNVFRYTVTLRGTIKEREAVYDIASTSSAKGRDFFQRSLCKAPNVALQNVLREEEREIATVLYCAVQSNSVWCRTAEFSGPRRCQSCSWPKPTR